MQRNEIKRNHHNRRTRKQKDTIKRLNEQLLKEKKIEAKVYTKYGTPRNLKLTLAPNGLCDVAGFLSISKMLKLTLQGSKVSKKRNSEIGHLGSSKPSNKELDFLRELMEDNNIVPAIDRTYPLNETAGAMRYFEDEHAKAKVVIAIDHEK